MSGIVNAFELELKEFLRDKGIADMIFIQQMPEDSDAKAIMLRAETLPSPLPMDVPIDVIRVTIATRDEHPRDALTAATAIANLIHGAKPGKFHPASSLSLLSAVMDERPQRVDNEERDLPQFIAFYSFRVKPLT